MKKLLMPYNSQVLKLKNHLVMAPMTRSRAIGNIPNALMAEYYSQRKGAGLIITEGTAPAPEGLGYARIPGIFSGEQIAGWKLTTAAVHQNNTKIFLQLMHTGRIGHTANLPEGVQVVGVSAIPAAGQMHTDTAGLQDYPVPVVLSTQGVKDVISEYVTAAKNAIAAGFDGVELHAANGYLIEQFFNPNINDRNDNYGGSIENRARFAIEIAQQVAGAIGKEKVGVRISPNSTLGDLQAYDADITEETYIHLSREFNRIGLAYIHISLNPQLPAQTLNAIRTEFEGTLIYCNAFTPQKAETELEKGDADLIAFGRPFLANPDFEQRIINGSELNAPDFTTLYTPGAHGYTDYPAERPNSIMTLDPQAGTDLAVVGGNYRLLITGKETDGAFAMIDMLIPPGGGPGPHAHTTFQESFYVIEGEIVVRTETQIYTAKKGAFVSIPKGGAIHAFKNETDSNARILCVVVAAGVEEFFQEIGQPVAYGEFLPVPEMTSEDAAQLQSIAAKYEQEIFPPDYFVTKTK